MKTELIEDIGYTQLPPTRDAFRSSKVSSFNVVLQLKIEKRRVTSSVPYFALMYSSFKFKINAYLM